MANMVYGFRALTGGERGCLDTLTSATVVDGDIAYGIVDNVHYAYTFSASSVAASNPPLVVAPISGTGRWLIAPAHIADHENILINGNLDVWQRSTSGNHTTCSYATVDRWRLGSVQDGVAWHPLTVARSTIAPEGSTHSMLLTTTNANDNRIVCQQRIESQETKKFKGKTLTFSVKWLRTGTLAAVTNLSTNLYYANAADNFATKTLVQTITFTDSLATTPIDAWTPLTCSFVVTDDMATNGFEIEIQIKTDATYTPLMSTARAVGRLAQFELREGSLPIPTRKRSFTEELALCQRYYWRGQLDGRGMGWKYGVANTDLYWGGSASFPVTMRTTPTVTIITDPLYVNCAHKDVTPVTPDGFAHRITVGSTTGSYVAYNGVYAADAEL